MCDGQEIALQQAAVGQGDPLVGHGAPVSDQLIDPGQERIDVAEQGRQRQRRLHAAPADQSFGGSRDLEHGAERLIGPGDASLRRLHQDRLIQVIDQQREAGTLHP